MSGTLRFANQPANRFAVTVALPTDYNYVSPARQQQKDIRLARPAALSTAGDPDDVTDRSIVRPTDRPKGRQKTDGQTDGQTESERTQPGYAYACVCGVLYTYASVSEVR